MTARSHSTGGELDNSTRDTIAELREDLDRQVQRYERAAARTTPGAGSDTSGCVTVVLDESGGVRSITVDATWHGELGADRLPGAVLEAYAAAGAERVRGWGAAAVEVAVEVADEAPPALRPAPPMYTGLAGRLAEVEGSRATLPSNDAMTASLLEMVRDIRTGMHEAFDVVEARIVAEHTGRSAAGHVQASVSGVGALLSLTFDDRWLPVAHAFNVGREATEAIHDALRRVPPTDPDALVAGTALERVLQLTRDAEALSAFVRGRDVR